MDEVFTRGTILCLQSVTRNASDSNTPLLYASLQYKDSSCCKPTTYILAEKRHVVQRETSLTSKSLQHCGGAVTGKVSMWWYLLNMLSFDAIYSELLAGSLDKL